MTFLQAYLATSVFITVVVIALGWHLQRQRARQEDARIDALIRPLTAEHYRFTGHDEQLSVDTSRRRDEAARKRREAARIDAGHPAGERIRLVGRL